MSNSLRLADLAEKFSFEFKGDLHFELISFSPLSEANSSQTAFLVNPIYRNDALSSKAGAIILNPSDYEYVKSHSKFQRTYIVSHNPYALFARLAQELEKLNGQESLGSIHPSAVIEPNVTIASSAYIGPFCTVKSGAVINDRVRLESHVFIGSQVVIGSDSVIHPMSSIYHDSQIGKRCIFHSGVVIGSDGFGFAPDFSENGGEWVKIPQTGRVIIGDDVELGASTTIDRGAMSDTVIGNGCKFDNQVQIGHNVRVGNHCVMAGCSGIAGSTQVGDLCVIGGYSNFAGHLTIADRTTVSGGTSIIKSITTPGLHFTGVFPFTQHSQWEKNAAILRSLDKMRQQLKNLMKLQ